MFRNDVSACEEFLLEMGVDYGFICGAVAVGSYNYETMVKILYYVFGYNDFDTAVEDYKANGQLV